MRTGPVRGQHAVDHLPRGFVLTWPPTIQTAPIEQFRPSLTVCGDRKRRSDHSAYKFTARCLFTEQRKLSPVRSLVLSVRPFETRAGKSLEFGTSFSLSGKKPSAGEVSPSVRAYNASLFFSLAVVVSEGRKGLSSERLGDATDVALTTTKPKARCAVVP
jgi:hypothetical protein